MGRDGASWVAIRVCFIICSRAMLSFWNGEVNILLNNTMQVPTDYG